MNQNHYERAMSLLEAAQGTKVESVGRLLTEQASVRALLAIGATLIQIKRSLDTGFDTMERELQNAAVSR